MLVIGICGSSAPSRRTRALVEEVLQAAQAYDDQVETEVIDLSTVTLDFCDGRKTEDYSQATQAVLEKIKNADALLFSSPMYRGSMTGALKNLIDLIPNEYIKGKSAGLVATGGSDHHYLGVELGLRAAMSFFQVHTVPGVLYQSKFTIEDGQIVEEKVIKQAKQFGQDIVDLASRTKDIALGPSLY